MKIILIDTNSKFIISTHSDAHVTLNKLRPWGMRRFGFLMDSPWVLPCWTCYLEQKPSIKQPNELPWCGEQPSEHGAAILRKLHAGAAAYCPRAVTREGSPAAACSCLLLPCAEMDRSPGLQSCQEPGLEVHILAPLQSLARQSRMAGSWEGRLCVSIVNCMLGNQSRKMTVAIVQ